MVLFAEASTGKTSLGLQRYSVNPEGRQGPGGEQREGLWGQGPAMSLCPWC